MVGEAPKIFFAFIEHFGIDTLELVRQQKR